MIRHTVQVLGLALLVLGALDVGRGFGQSPPTGESADSPESLGVRRLLVPADNPQLWPAGSWEPWPADRLRDSLELVRRARQHRSGPPFGEANYTATLLGDSLREGRLRWSLSRPSEEAAFLELTPLEFPVDTLVWEFPGEARRLDGEREVLWGRASDGRLGFCTLPGRRVLRGQWGLDGRRQGSSLEFRFQFPPAMMTRIALKVPAGLVLTSSAGRVEGPLAAEESGWSLWRIELGQLNRCRLRLTPAVPDSSAARLVVSRPDLSFVVRPEATRFRALFDLSAWESPVREIEFDIPAEAELTAVLLGDSAAEWRRAETSRDRLQLVLPEPVRGELRRVELRGILPATEDAGWRMPLFRARDAVELEGHVAVRLASPFRAAAVHFAGLRQFVYDPSADDEVFEFRRLRSDATLDFAPATRPIRLSCRTLGLISLAEECQVQTVLDWTAVEGSTWSTACRISADWEVIDVRLPSGERTEVAVDWSLEPEGAQGQRLVFHFSDALTPETPIRLQTILRSRMAPALQQIVLPVIAPIADVAAENLTLISSERRLDPDSDAGQEFERLEVVDLPDESLELDFVRSAITQGAPELFALRSRDLQSQGTLVIDRSGVAAAGTPRSGEPTEAPERAVLVSPLVVRSVRAAVTVCGEESGFDSYRLELDVLGDSEGELRWTFPREAELPAVLQGATSAIPLPGQTDFLGGITLAGDGELVGGQTLRRVVVQYRVAATMQWGPSRRELVWPRLAVPVLGTQFEIRFPQSIRLAHAPSGLRPLKLEPTGGWIPPLAGPLGRTAGEVLFNPLLASDWRRLLVGESTAEEPPAPWTTWRGDSLELPETIELVVWNRNEAASLNWWSFLAALWLGLAVRIQWPSRPLRVIAAALALGLLGATFLPVTFAEVQGSGFAGLVCSQLVPTAWIWSRRTSTAGPMISTRIGSPLRLTALWILVAVSLVAPRRGLSQAPEASPADPSLDRLGDVLIPVADGDEGAEWPRVVYVSRELRQRLAELVRRSELPAVLLRDIGCDLQPDDRERPLIRVRLTYCLTGMSAVRIPLPFAGVTLAEDLSCLVAGSPCELLPATDGPGYVLEYDPLRAALEQASQGDRPPAPELPVPADQTGQILEVALRLLPTSDADGPEGIRRIQIPVAARATLPHWDGLVRDWGSFPDGIGLSTTSGEGLQWRHAVFARLVDWPSELRPDRERTDPLKVEASSLVEFDGSVAVVRCWARYVPGGQPIDWLLWRIPAGMAVRQVNSPQLSGFLTREGPSGDRLLEIQFLEPRSEPFEVAVDLSLPLRESQFELRLPDPAIDPRGSPFAVELRQFRVALRYPADRRVQVSSPVVDQPLRSANIADLTRDGRFGEVVPNAAYELDRPLALLLLMQPAELQLAAAIEQRGTLQPGHLEWKFVADGVRSSQSVFQYELEIDPRLEIRRLAVYERDVERLARWSREGSRVTLFLAARAGSSQRIELTAVLPIRTEGDLEPPRIELVGLNASIERRVLIVRPGVDASLIADSSPSLGPDESGVMFDAPAPPSAPWPRLRLVTTATRPPVPAPPEEVHAAPDAPGDDSRPDKLATIELAEVNLQRTARLELRGRLRLWIPPGDAAEVTLAIPEGTRLECLVWNDAALPLPTVDGVEYRALLPIREEGGVLEATWSGVAPAFPPLPSPWGQSFDPCVWPRDTAVARLLLSYVHTTDTVLSVRAPFRRLTADGADEVRRQADRAIRRTGDEGERDEVAAAGEFLLGAQGAVAELGRSGVPVGVSWVDWSRLKPLAVAGLFLLLALLLWGLVTPIRWLQSHSGVCGLVVGLIWWGFLAPSGLGCMLSLASLPFAVLDLLRAARRPVVVRPTYT